VLSVSEVLPNDVVDIVPGTGRRSIRRQDDGIPVRGLLPSVSEECSRTWRQYNVGTHIDPFAPSQVDPAGFVKLNCGGSGDDKG
jgi:hypothetical protein